MPHRKSIIGKLILVLGAMFSGKSEESQRRGRRRVIAGERVATFRRSGDTKPNLTHAGNGLINPIVVDSEEEILQYLDEFDVFIIEELQFWEKSIVGIILFLVQQGKIVIANSLLADYRAMKFGFTNDLLPHANEIIHVKAICTECGSEEGIYSQKIAGGTGQIEVGEENLYKAVCPQCYRFYLETQALIDRARQTYDDMRTAKV